MGGEGAPDDFSIGGLVEYLGFLAQLGPFTRMRYVDQRTVAANPLVIPNRSEPSAMTVDRLTPGARGFRHLPHQTGQVIRPKGFVLPLTFTTPQLGTVTEMRRQLALQQTALNAKNPCQAASDIAQYPVNQPIGEAARPAARARFIDQNARALLRTLPSNTTFAQARTIAEAQARRQDAIHTLDMVAGGNPTGFRGLAVDRKTVRSGRNGAVARRVCLRHMRRINAATVAPGCRFCFRLPDARRTTGDTPWLTVLNFWMSSALRWVAVFHRPQSLRRGKAASPRT